ncbi:MAG TPA: tetratricopeptide repeat protein, partial [Polyangiaceae bacterium]|nr:tetratricopeptide repeat protein [Polyangiaceae bacterium]
ETIELSWGRLDACERRALSHCSLFTDTFRIDAAEAVIAHPDALQGLQGLRDKSLLARVGTRCRLYAPVRAVAAGHLDAVEPARARFVQHYAAFAERELARLEGPDADVALRSLIDETEHLRAAWIHAPEGLRPALARGLAEVALTRGPVSTALEVIVGLPKMLVIQGRALEILGRTDDAIRCYQRARPEASTLLAHAELASGKLAAAVESVARAVSTTTPRTLARVGALRMRGLVHHARGDLDRAFEDYRDARVMATELGSSGRAARLRADIGAVRLQQGRLDEARECYRSAIEDLDERTDPIPLSLAEGNLAILEQELGGLEEAASLHARAYARVRRLGHRLYTAHLAGYAGAVEHERGDLRAALQRYGEALDGLRRVGDARLIAVIGALRGAAEAGRDRVEAAEEAFREVREVLESVDDPGVERAAQVHLHHLALARARAGERPQGDVRIAARNECLELERDPALSRSDDLRLALRLLRAALGHGSLRLNTSTRRISLPDGSLVDLSRRAVLWRLVEALAAARMEKPPRPMDAEALLSAGWPGEAPTGESGLNRVKVALSTLRKLGLREVLCRRDGGYLFDPDVPLG